MPSNYQIQKVNKKQRRCCTIISNECSIVSSEVPTQFVAILNAGLSTGLTDERVLAEASKYGAVQQLHMLPGKSYCFIIAGTVSDATQIYEGMHNKAALGQDDTHVYLAYFEQVPPFENPWMRPAPNGLIVLEEFITSVEETTLLEAIAKSLESASDADTLKHRQVAHFGFEFIYGINNVDVNAPLEQQIPSACDALWPRLQQTLDDKGLQAAWSVPDQLTVNVYQPGQGIPPHVDTHSAFGDAIMSLSLESDVVMEFRKGSERAFIRLPRRSLLIMCGEARYAWTHGIAPRMLDIVPTTTTTLASALTTQRRCKRTSFTFRKLRRGTCDCAFPTLCDTRLNATQSTTTTTAAVAAQLEKLNVHSVYDIIADHFSETRHKQWPQVADFINSFECGAVLMDVGCGNGKYLTANSDMLKIGCDRSVGLLSLCASNKQSVFKCDCLQLPVRSASMDGCISIAVIHHLSTPERRLSAIREMARILVPGGRALIYVWAKNQQANDKKSSYLRQNKAVNKQKITEDEQRQLTAELQPSEASIFDLPIHTNRTQFQQQDMLVPWKLKNLHGDSSTYLRYYHVFEIEELERLVSKIPEVDTVRSYYDQGNYCIIFKRKI